MTNGFAAEGFEPSLAVEFDLHAAATYAANFGEDHVLRRDVADVRDSEIPRADVVIVFLLENKILSNIEVTLPFFDAK